MKYILLLLLATGLQASLWAQKQLTTQFQLPSNLHPKRLLLKVSIPVGNSVFISGSQSYPLQIEGTPAVQEVSKFSHQAIGDGYVVNFSAYEHTGQSAMELDRSYGKEMWRFLLNPAIPTDLDLSFGLGNASLNLSGMAVSHVGMRTGNTNVSLKYDEGNGNASEMQIFDAKVDVGILSIERLNLSRARTFQAEIGVGALSINFSNVLPNAMNLLINVGAGSLSVALPSDSAVPISIKINSSFLSVVTLPKHFQKSGNVYGNQAYWANPSGKGLTFDITVSMGKVNFSQNGPE